MRKPRGKCLEKIGWKVWSGYGFLDPSPQESASVELKRALNSLWPSRTDPNNALMCAVPKDDAGADAEPEIVPSAVVVKLVHADSLLKRFNDKSERGNQSVPETTEKAGGFCTCRTVF